MDTMIKNAKRMELHAIYAMVFLNTQNLKMIIKKFEEKLKERFSNTHKFSTHDHANYAHAKRVCKDFLMKIVGEYHDLYVQNNTLLSADVFEDFRNICLKIYDFDSTRFLTAPGLAWQAA